MRLARCVCSWLLSFTFLAGCSTHSQKAIVDVDLSPDKKLVAHIEQYNEKRSRFTYRITIWRTKDAEHIRLDLPIADVSPRTEDCWATWVENRTLTVFVVHEYVKVRKSEKVVNLLGDEITLRIFTGPALELQQRYEILELERLKGKYEGKR